MTHRLNEYFRLPTDWTSCSLSEKPAGAPGFFRFGSEIICYGRCKTGAVAKTALAYLYDASKDVCLDECNVRLPFDPSEVIENLYRERYEQNLRPAWERINGHELIRKSYYFVRGLLPVSVRRHLQRAYFSGWQQLPFPAWPVDFTVDTLHQELLKLSMEARSVRKVPFIWFWPEGAPNCLIMTHDVETSAGRDFTPQLMDLDKSYGIKASFQVIPEKRYEVPDGYVQEIRSRGFEFNIHDLNHDGHLYKERREFLRRAKRINEYVQRFNSCGFRAGSMYRNPDWYDAFEFSYDMSVPNVAHLEPKRGGCCTVMPFFIGGIVELPLTTTQDYSLFHILNDYSIDLWKTQLELIRQRNGLMSFITHPDYLITHRERKVYESLLNYLQEMIAREKIWAPLPREVDRWWRARSQMKLVPCDSGWKIEGPGKERARIAYAVLKGGRLVYEL
jgi:Polysaccharide deacetylase